ncbi:MAG: Flp pilus assembly protein CpaB [Victivallales bacterium]|nr:Flp pilus assembly protein CpaB [Victivallales bacterium]
MKQKLLLVVAVFFGLLAFVLTYKQIENERRSIRGKTLVMSFVCLKRSMASGETIKAQDIERYDDKRFRQSRGRDASEVLWAQAGTVIGRNLEVPVEKGHVLLWRDLRPASGRKEGLTGIVPMGYRAVAIPVDGITSVAGLVRPGNHVDIVGTFRFPEMQGDRALDTLTLTLLQNVVVLAVGDDMGRAFSLDNKPDKHYSSVTLCPTPREVEMIVFAEQKGKLSLSLRNYEETEIVPELPSINFRFLEQNLGQYNKERSAKMLYNRD